MTDTDLMAQGCARTLLADVPPVRVEKCGCGHVHLTLGPVTLRLEPAVFEALVQAAGVAGWALYLTADAQGGSTRTGGWPAPFYFAVPKADG